MLLRVTSRFVWTSPDAPCNTTPHPPPSFLFYLSRKEKGIMACRFIYRYRLGLNCSNHWRPEALEESSFVFHGPGIS